MTDINGKIAKEIKAKLLEYKKRFPESTFIITGEYDKCLCFINNFIEHREK